MCFMGDCLNIWEFWHRPLQVAISAAIAFSAPDHHRDKNVHSGQQIYLLPSCDSSAKADNNDD